MTACPTTDHGSEADPPAEGWAAPVIRTPCDEVRELRRELRRKRRFASDASHELRSAVAALRMELDEARLHPDETDFGDLLTRAIRGVDRLHAIITDLRVLAEMEAGPPVRFQRVDLAELVGDEIARRRDRIAVRLLLEHGVVVRAVPIRIVRVLTNLLDNAQRHARHLVEVRVGRDGDHAELTVVDDGEGVADPDRERIFQRFTRLRAARRLDHTGTGLGLAIARDIAHAHVGTLRAEASEGGGARFVLRLPFAGPAASTRLESVIDDLAAIEVRPGRAAGASGPDGPACSRFHEHRRKEST
ncbi:HAMP domain-containing sensor histidine kinase [Nonomuraea sp. NPDC050643]|uniref:sensor histidine kinase n=1 Tax=Nonomuraea sp. NPDC050643 TaxID=3155660 RepID=UPI0033EF3DE0